MKDVKGSSSRFINNLEGLNGLFRWQSSYGVLSFHRSRLNGLIAYVQGQAQHHATGSLMDELERSDGA